MNLVFARGLNYEFSLKDGTLPWTNHKDLAEDCKHDMQHFKNLTVNNIILMGFNTYKTFSRPLPDRLNIVTDKNSTVSDFIKTDDFNFLSGVNKALNKPDLSPIPIPIKEVINKNNGLNILKLLVALVKIYLKPEGVKIF